MNDVFSSVNSEFFTNENTAIVWGDQYDVSTDKHVLSNEQITLQSTTRSSSMSATLQTTRNESIVMDISNLAGQATATTTVTSHENKPSVKSLNFSKHMPYREDQKENIMVGDDMELELSMCMPPPPAPPSKKSMFSTSMKPSLFNFTQKNNAVESPQISERTTGSDIMDISGIEPTIEPNPIRSNATALTKSESSYTAWLKQNGFKADEKNDHRQSTNQPEDIDLCQSQIVVEPPIVTKKQNTRKTINEPLDMTLETTNDPLSSVQPNSRRSINEPQDLSLEDVTTQANHCKPVSNTKSIENKIEVLPMSNVSVEYLPMAKSSHRRQTITKAEDMDVEENPTQSYVMQNERSLMTKSFGFSNKDLSIDNFNLSKMHNYNYSQMPGTTVCFTKMPSDRRQTVNRSQNMDIEKSYAETSNVGARKMDNSKPSVPPNKRQTINQAQNMSFDMHDEPLNANTCNRTAELSVKCPTESSRRQTISQIQDMDLELPVAGEGAAPSKASSHPSNKRQTINQPQEMSFVTYNTRSKSLNQNQIVEAPARSEKQALRRQTTHESKDISLDVPKSEARAYLKDIYDIKDMSLDTIVIPAVQSVNTKSQKSSSMTASRMTINEPRDMSFESNATGKSKAYSCNNKTILVDMSMELQSTASSVQQNRQSVIFKSPCKSATKRFDQSSLELTKPIDSDMSYHPMHSTKLYDNNCSKFTDVDFDESVVDENEPTPKPPPCPAKRSVQIFNPIQNQTIQKSLEMSEEDSPIPTAKKFNPNKTPFYVELDKENILLDTMCASDSSSIVLSDNSTNEKPKAAMQQAAVELRRETAYLHETIKADDSQMMASNKKSMEAIEISDDAIEPLELQPMHRSTGARRKTCIQEVSMVIDTVPQPESKRLSTFNQSLFQLSSMDIDPIPINDLEPQVADTKRFSFNNFEGSANTSNACDESKQLTFIEDDEEDEDQICNTKLDLAISLDSSSGTIEDMVERKCESYANKTQDISRFSIADSVMQSIGSAIDVSKQSLDLPIPPTAAELEAFRRKDRLRRSNVYDGNETASTNHSKNSTVTNDDGPYQRLGSPNQSSIMQRRSINATNDDPNETSFLMKRPDKPLSEIRLDYSGYEKLAGLATPLDVIEEFTRRMEKINRQKEEWAEQRRKFAAGEIDSFDIFNNNDVDSQNLEAPSWTFLYKNKIECEL